MIKVVDKFKLKNGMSVLVCEKFDTSKATDTIMTKNGKVKKPDFEISPSLGCFSEPKTCDVVIKKRDFDTSDILEIKFA
jgi:hypothetical protein